MDGIVELAAKVGLPTALAIFLIYQNYERDKRDEKREERMGKRLDEQQMHIQTFAETVVKDNTVAMQANTTATRTLCDKVDGNTAMMRDFLKGRG